MSHRLVEIQPHELKFVFELKKQSSCTVHLTNVTDQYVAFKVKTTSPKKYCVRPNVGIIMPRSTCDFTVTMQAQRSAPPEMQCKDKFLIQSTIVPFGSTEEDITSDMFAKDSEKHIEESKLRVVLTSPPHSPVLLPVNGVAKQEPTHATAVQKDKRQSGVENFPPPQMLVENIEENVKVPATEESRPPKVEENVKIVPDKDESSSPIKSQEVIHKYNEDSSPKMSQELTPKRDEESRAPKDEEAVNLNLTKDIEELKLNIRTLDSKLIEAERTILKLKEERSSTMHHTEALKQELAMLSRKSGLRRKQVGFPPLFVCMVALISVTVGYLLRS